MRQTIHPKPPNTKASVPPPSDTEFLNKLNRLVKIRYILAAASYEYVLIISTPAVYKGKGANETVTKFDIREWIKAQPEPR